MKQIFNQMKRVFLFLMCGCIAITSSSCNKGEDVVMEGDSYVYYIDKDYTTIVQKAYEIKETNVDDRIDELLERLRLNTEDVKTRKAIPDGVSVEGYTLEDGVLALEFNAEYEAMDISEEVLTRAAIVLTMIQLEEVDCVSITVGGQPLADSKGEPIGNMNSSNFASNLDKNNDTNNTDSFCIYFANQDGTALSGYEFEAEYSSTTSKEQVIVNKLVEGPGEEEGFLRTVPANVEVVRVVTTDNVCYVYFGQNFLTEPTNVPDELVIYSIVNSLSELPYIHKVQISISGKPEALFHNKISLVEPFVRNLDYMEESSSK